MASGFSRETSSQKTMDKCFANSEGKPFPSYHSYIQLYQLVVLIFNSRIYILVEAIRDLLTSDYLLGWFMEFSGEPECADLNATLLVHTQDHCGSCT